MQRFMRCKEPQMKIIGVAYHEGERHIILKSDSSLLNGRKPFFSPEGMQCVSAHPCLVFRIGRMGKHIEPRFAWRYIDGYAAGLHLEDSELLSASRRNGSDWTFATAMDGSMPVGVFTRPQEEACNEQYTFRLYNSVADIAEGKYGDEKKLHLNDSPEDIVSMLSKTITLRQGDMIFIATPDKPFEANNNNCIVAFTDNEDVLFCKVK
ncbi:MAG: fumarylacetoacetate hydrolase family protein [Paludibacteraceae bacterium]|nr:fumarylacetoacetate hydrolase family protein [Paludibacteraceae bacterium]